MATTAPASRSDRTTRILELRRGGWPYSRIAAELGVGTATVSRTVTKLPEDERLQIERQARAAGQASRHAEVRAELLAELAPCGSPGCTDPLCTIEPWHCHHCESKEVAAAPQTHRVARTVFGHPLMYCSRACRGAASNGALGETALQILAEIGVGACGCVGCPPDCGATPGVCHADGCDHPTRSAAQTDARIPTVRGRPLKHCSRRCERAANAAALAKVAAANRERERAARSALRSEGLEPVLAAAKKTFRSAQAVRRSQTTPIVRRTIGGVVRLGVDVQQLLANAPAGTERKRLGGQLNRARSAQRGTVFGRPNTEALRPGTTARILELSASGQSIRTIARLTGVSKSHVARVAKAAAVPKP